MGRMKDLWVNWGTIWMIEQFGLWVNQPAGIHLGYPKKTNFAVMQGRSVSLPKIDDDIASFIHDSINELGQRYPKHKALLISYYVRRRSFERAGEEHGLKRAKSIEVIRAAEAWIDCKLNDYFKLSHTRTQVLKPLREV